MPSAKQCHDSQSGANVRRQLANVRDYCKPPVGCFPWPGTQYNCTANHVQHRSSFQSSPFFPPSIFYFALIFSETLWSNSGSFAATGLSTGCASSNKATHYFQWDVKPPNLLTGLFTCLHIQLANFFFPFKESKENKIGQVWDNFLYAIISALEIGPACSSKH